MAQRLFEVSEDLLGSAEPRGRFTSLNPAWEHTLGFSRPELMQQPWIEFVHLADRKHTLAQARATAVGSEVRRFENRVATKDGGWRWLSWQCFRHGPGFDFVVHDVTMRVADRQRAHLASHIVAGVDDAILTKTTDGIVTSWNLAAECLYGYNGRGGHRRT